MVRQKSRWLLVRIDFKRHAEGSTENSQDQISHIDSKDVFVSVKDVMECAFGIVGAAFVEEIQGMRALV